jgi:F-type H+-transporting ATPase subunit epsilon
MAGHAPFVSTLRPGVVDVIAGGNTRRLLVRGGIAEVTPERGLTILAAAAVPVEELDAARLDQEIRDADEALAKASTDEGRRRAQEMLTRLRELRAGGASVQAAASH